MSMGGDKCLIERKSICKFPRAIKERWKQYADETHRSLSDLIRLAVKKEVNQDGPTVEGLSDETLRQLSTLVESVERVEQKADDFETRLRSIETEVKDDPSIKALANDLFEILPDSEEEVVEAEHQDLKGESVPPHTKAPSGRVEDIGGRLERS